MRKGRATFENLFGSPSRNLLTILGLMAVIVTVATAAYMAAGWSFADASYMVALTINTVGFEEVRPISTPHLHVVTMTTMVLGCTGIILLTSAVVQLFTELQLRQIFGTTRMQNRIDDLDDHVVICGYGRIGVMLAREFAEAKISLAALAQPGEAGPGERGRPSLPDGRRHAGGGPALGRHRPISAPSGSRASCFTRSAATWETARRLPK